MKDNPRCGGTGMFRIVDDISYTRGFRIDPCPGCPDCHPAASPTPTDAGSVESPDPGDLQRRIMHIIGSLKLRITQDGTEGADTLENVTVSVIRQLAAERDKWRAAYEQLRNETG